MIHRPSTVMPMLRADRDGAHGRVQIGGRQVLHLGLGDFLGLARVELPTLSVCGLAETLVQAAFFDQDRGRRRLDDEREALVGEAVITTGSADRLHALGLGVERLAEFHDVQAALTQRRTDRRRRGSPLPAGTCSLMKPTIFFTMRMLLAGTSAPAQSPSALNPPGAESDGAQPGEV